ncbi:hypothetical protein CYFUS_008087 [Cystobacter fuscus]|uniref:Uncharacterized protein n=1 Tax=Cystobacter fuscus TaxID=43 RepID=A0A250JG81_9BACT|nr:hypothetical protein [Cystobacter fuscus]ATB42608.1 hypothetical protein CYFUS_008087 [Cystobacter fuscus]
MEGIGKFFGGVANVLSGGFLVDTLGNALGLPPVVTNTIKTVVGAATGNVMLAMDGAAGVAQELGKNPPASTEYCPPKDSARACEGYSRPTHGSSPVGGSEGRLDPKMKDYLQSLQTLERNFQYLDATDGKMEGILRLSDLQRIAGDRRVSPELREAARFLVANPGYFERLDVSTDARGLMEGPFRAFKNDNAFNVQDLRGEIGKVKAELAAGGTARPPPGQSCPTTGGSAPGSTSGSTASSSVKGIINDPNMSLEEKINAILMNLTEKMDDEILQTMDSLAAAQDKKAGISNEKGNEKSLTEAQRDIDRLSMRLQQLVEKRKTMFEMMSTMSMKFNEMAKTALSNMRSA